VAERDVRAAPVRIARRIQFDPQRLQQSLPQPIRYSVCRIDFAQVARRQVNLPIKDNIVGWREALTKVLETMANF